MDDKTIVDLFWHRDPQAIDVTAAKYGHYCKAIAGRILGSDEDADECVNDTYLHAWNAIPPHRPTVLSTFLGKITRRLSFDKIRRKTAEKRGGGEMHLILDELAECVSGDENVEESYTRKELVAEINAFLNTLPQEKCDVFLCRYWYALSVAEIAKRFGMSENSVYTQLCRTRSKLKTHLTERGFDT